uniref:Solute carrier family 35 member B4 n=1 Tax=Myotis myotis TaxID=51298 RepID=A0A7J7V4W0_MYOMY|nr:solute carrier family 35 member B4 [Myotis myotis]
MPLHMMFRPASTAAQIRFSNCLGIIILKKRYSIFKYASIALVSVGIFICTSMSAKQVTYQSSLSENEGFQAFTWWLLGIGALTFALLMSARMGIFQETLYKQFGKHSKEALFYNNYIKFRLLVWQCPSCGSTSSRMSSLSTCAFGVS